MRFCASVVAPFVTCAKSNFEVVKVFFSSGVGGGGVWGAS